MRKTAVILLFLGAALSSARAELLFSDDFTTSTQSDNVNFEYTAGRESGSLANLTYLQGNGFFSSVIAGSVTNEPTNGFETQVGGAPNTLWLAEGGTGSVIGSVSPNHDFTEDPGVDGYMDITFTLIPAVASAGTSSDWGAITLGASDNASFGSSGAGARGQFVNNTAAHFAILFTADGEYQAFDGSEEVGDDVYTDTPTDMLEHTIELRISGVDDGNPWDGSGDALIDAFADGALTPFFEYTVPGGYLDNYITLEGFAQTSQFDNLTIRTVPEPATSGLVLASAGVVLAWKRRRLRDS